MSKMTMEAVVQDIEIRQVEKRDGSGSITLYDVVIADGTKWTAFERELAERAHRLKGVPSLLEVTVEQKGNYTNKNLRQIQAKPTAGFNPALNAMEAQLGNGLGNASDSLPMPDDSIFSPSKPLVEEPSYKDRNIWRQTACKVAAHLAKTETEFWGSVDALVKYFETGEKPLGLNSLIESGQVQVGTGNVEQPPPFDDSNIPF